MWHLQWNGLLPKPKRLLTRNSGVPNSDQWFSVRLVQTQLEYGGIQQTFVSNPPSRSRHWIFLGPTEATLNPCQLSTVHYSRAGTLSPFDVWSLGRLQALLQLLSLIRWPKSENKSGQGGKCRRAPKKRQIALYEHLQRKMTACSSMQLQSSRTNFNYECVYLTLTTRILPLRKYHEWAGICCKQSKFKAGQQTKQDVSQGLSHCLKANSPCPILLLTEKRILTLCHSIFIISVTCNPLIYKWVSSWFLFFEDKHKVSEEAHVSFAEVPLLE